MAQQSQIDDNTASTNAYGDELSQEVGTSSYYPDPPADVTGGLPINLDSLRDGPPGTKPFYPYSTLIRYAIKGSPNQKLLLEDIYYAIESRFPYFRNAPPGWKNSVRHNLSLNPCFVKVARPLTDRGKGSYWTVNDNVDPRTGVHRIRKKRPKLSKPASAAAAAAAAATAHLDLDPPEPEEDQDGEYDESELGYPFNELGFMSNPVPEAEPTEQVVETESPTHSVADNNVETTHPAEEFLPEVDTAGNPIWRNMWLNELAKLRHFTTEQDKLNVSPEWYRMMVTRVRGAFLAPEGLEMGDDMEEDAPV